MAIFPDAEDDGGGEQAEEGVEDYRRPSGEVVIEPADDATAVDQGERGFGSLGD